MARCGTQIRTYPSPNLDNFGAFGQRSAVSNTEFGIACSSCRIVVTNNAVRVRAGVFRVRPTKYRYKPCFCATAQICGIPLWDDAGSCVQTCEQGSDTVMITILYTCTCIAAPATISSQKKIAKAATDGLGAMTRARV